MKPAILLATLIFLVILESNEGSSHHSLKHEDSNKKSDHSKSHPKHIKKDIENEADIAEDSSYLDSESAESNEWAPIDDEDTYDVEAPDTFDDEELEDFDDEAAHPVDESISFAEVVDTAEVVTEVIHDFTSVFKVLGDKKTGSLLKSVTSICKYAGKAAGVLGAVLTLIEPEDVSLVLKVPLLIWQKRGELKILERVFRLPIWIN